MAKDAAAKTVIGLVLFALVVLGWGIAFGYIKSDVYHIDEQANGNTVKIEVMDEKVDNNKEMLIRIETRQEVVIKGIDEIKAELKK